MTESVTITAPCPSCTQPAQWRGTVAALGGGTTWRIDCNNPACRPPALKETA